MFGEKITGGLYRYEHDGSMCKYGNMINFNMSTGIENAPYLPVKSYLDYSDLIANALVTCDW